MANKNKILIPLTPNTDLKKMKRIKNMNTTYRVPYQMTQLEIWLSLVNMEAENHPLLIHIFRINLIF